ncbi:MAG: hypothetical protein OEU32_04995 [Acidimicrobiia bacterium]|nr:hypothetical protein [Acidimicrobiia bacterium]
MFTPESATVAARISRRRFATGALAAGAVAAGSGTLLFVATRDGAGFVPYAFAIDHDAAISVIIGAGEQFTVTVRKGAEILEQFDDVTADTLLGLDSDHLTFRQVAIPSGS